MNKQAQNQQAGEPDQGARQKPQEYYTDMPVGEILRRAREHCGRSLADVEAALRIRASQLRAIEEGDPEKLPGRVYAIGFVRSYAEYLGLDGNQMVQLFKSQSVNSRNKPSLNFPAPPSESRLPSALFVIVSLILAGGFLYGWSSYDGWNVAPVEDIPPAISSQTAQMKASPPSPPAPTAMAPATMQEETAAFPPATSAAPQQGPIEIRRDPQTGAVVASQSQPESIGPQPLNREIPDPYAPAQMQGPPIPAAQSAPQEEGEAQQQQTAATTTPETTQMQAAPATAQEQEEGITLNVLENSWVEIRDQEGRAIVSRVLNAGDQYFVPNRPDLTMSLGNAGGVEILMDGETLPLLGPPGSVRRNISLDVETLKNLAGAGE